MHHGAHLQGSRRPCAHVMVRDKDVQLRQFTVADLRLSLTFASPRWRAGGQHWSVLCTEMVSRDVEPRRELVWHSNWHTEFFGPRRRGSSAHRRERGEEARRTSLADERLWSASAGPTFSNFCFWPFQLWPVVLWPGLFLARSVFGLVKPTLARSATSLNFGARPPSPGPPCPGPPSPGARPPKISLFLFPSPSTIHFYSPLLPLPFSSLHTPFYHPLVTSLITFSLIPLFWSPLQSRFLGHLSGHTFFTRWHPVGHLPLVTLFITLFIWSPLQSPFQSSLLAISLVSPMLGTPLVILVVTFCHPFCDPFYLHFTHCFTFFTLFFLENAI